MKQVGLALTVILLACSKAGPNATQTDQTPLAANEIVARPSADDKPGPQPPAKPLTEPQGAIDPKSVEAAGQVVQHYGALIEQGKFADAAQCWGDARAASAFDKELRTRGLNHLEIGDPGEPEGAAGSVYVTMPVVFYTGERRAPAEITLRRVNDVPGSTDAQRRWQIERIEWNR